MREQKSEFYSTKKCGEFEMEERKENENEKVLKLSREKK